MGMRGQNIRIYQVDAFTSELFCGNPAAVCILSEWLPYNVLQNIANENNLTATAFIVKNNNFYEIKWYSPVAEIKLCGHGTLAAAHVIFNYLENDINRIRFITRDYDLVAERFQTGIRLDFPAFPIDRFTETPHELLSCLSIQPKDYLLSNNYLFVYDNEQEIINLVINFHKLNKINHRGLIVTAPGEQVDFVSRFFPPLTTINEDHATGSAHCCLAPYWMERTGKNKLNARQLSQRGAEIICEVRSEGVTLFGNAKTFLQGTIIVNLQSL